MTPRGTLRQAQGRRSLAARGSSALVEDGRGGTAAQRAPGRGAARLAGQRLGLRGSCSARAAAALGWLAASEGRGAAAALPGPTAGEARAGAWASHGAPLRRWAGTERYEARTCVPSYVRWQRQTRGRISLPTR